VARDTRIRIPTATAGRQGEHCAQPDGGGTQDRVEPILRRYRRGLSEAGLPVAEDSDTWRRCELIARRILEGRALTADADHLLCLKAATVLAETVSDAMVEAGIPEHRRDAAMRAIRRGTGTLLGSDESAAAVDGGRRRARAGSGRAARSARQPPDAARASAVPEPGRPAEAARLARDLHDHVGSSLALAMRQLELLEPHLPGPQAAPEAARRLGASLEAVREALAQTRRLVGGLRPIAADTPLADALGQFCAVMARPGVDVRILVDGDQERIPAALRSELFVMVRECLRNAFAHAAPRLVSVRIGIAPHEIHAEIEDDGTGFDPSARAGERRGGGLTGLRERAAALRGTLDVLSAPGLGTAVALRLPLGDGRIAP
jgi:signal transduction histidine kinase